MADTIKIGNLDISAFKVGSYDCKVYIGDTLLYPHSSSFKWKATFTGGTTSSAQCDSTSAITAGEIGGQEAYTISSVEVGNCVTEIGMGAFEYYDSLTSIDIPNSVTSIGESAFYYCSSLTSIDIPDSVTSIGNWAFADCTNLTSVNIGSGITSIGESAFIALNRLTGVTINATTPPALGYDVFVYTNCPIYVPSVSVNAYKAASGWSDYASRIQAISNS